MSADIKDKINSIPHKGGIIGAMAGALASVLFIHKGDKPLKNAGKAVVFTGTGFLLGEWIEKWLKKK